MVPFHLETAIPVILSQGVGLTCPKAQGAESISARMMMQYAADPSSSVAASCKQVHKDLVTVHNEHHMCPVHVQRSDVQRINASTALCLMCRHLLLMVAADRDNMVIEHHQLMMTMLRIPDHQSLLHLMIQTL